MTEVDWLHCEDPGPMLRFIQPRAGDRKLRMFLLACCREPWGPAADEATRYALAVATQVADAGPDGMTVAEARVLAGQVVIDCGASIPYEPVVKWTDEARRKKVASSAAAPLLEGVLGALACSRLRDWPAARWGAMLHGIEARGVGPARQAALLRDVCRGPFRPIHFLAAWRAGNVGAIHGVAHAIYQGEAFDELPVLGDVLEDAGCAEDEILGHLRGPGPHVRGCWVLDLILGKG
jgi:hypothetical protein